MGVPLSPGMASRKLQVLDFAKRFYLRWGRSPSYGEIAGELGISRDRVKAHVRTLTAEGAIIRAKGAHRGITFPDHEQDLKQKAHALGFDLILRSAYPTEPATNTTLPLIAELDHIPDVEIHDEGHHDKTSAGNRQARAGRADRAD